MTDRPTREEVPAYRDPLNPGNVVRPDVRCLGCGALGCTTAWGPWCFECNVARIERITASLKEIVARMRGDHD